MAFVYNNRNYPIGTRVITTKKVESCCGYFEVGTEVKITGISERGYDLEDEYGNKILETGFGSVRSMEASE